MLHLLKCCFFSGLTNVLKVPFVIEVQKYQRDLKPPSFQKTWRFGVLRRLETSESGLGVRRRLETSDSGDGMDSEVSDFGLSNIRIYLNPVLFRNHPG